MKNPEIQNPDTNSEKVSNLITAAIRTPEDLIRCYKILDTTKELYPEDELCSILGALSIVGQTFASQTIHTKHMAKVIPLNRRISEAS